MTILACMVSQKSLTKNFDIQSMERKKIGQIQGKISRRRLAGNPMIQYIIINLHTKYDYSSLHNSQKSETKNFIIQSVERKKIGQIQGRITRRKLVHNPTIQYIIINLLTKYDYSSLHDFTEIFEEKFHYSEYMYGKKENLTNTEKNKHEKAGLQSHNTNIIINLHTKYDYSSLHSFTGIFDEKFHYSNYGKNEIGQI